MGVSRPLVHGTPGRYSRGCRCAECREAHRVYQVELRAERRTQILPPGDPRHGFRAGYEHWGCRCEDCSAARRDASKKSYWANPSLGRARARRYDRRQRGQESRQGLCCRCGQMYALTKSGMVRRHGDPDRVGLPCPGSGLPRLERGD